MKKKITKQEKKAHRVWNDSMRLSAILDKMVTDSWLFYPPEVIRYNITPQQRYSHSDHKTHYTGELDISMNREGEWVKWDDVKHKIKG